MGAGLLGGGDVRLVLHPVVPAHVEPVTAAAEEEEERQRERERERFAFCRVSAHTLVTLLFDHQKAYFMIRYRNEHLSLHIIYT